MASMSLSALGTVGMIFGGCCSNVYALEAILRNSSDSGLLVTFCQFVFAAAISFPFQLSNPSDVETPIAPRVPIRTWAITSLMFFAINMLNNWAFAFDISLPVHIVLRSFSSVATMTMGFFRGKRYTRLQVCSVCLLTAGVLVSARADAEMKIARRRADPTQAPPSGRVQTSSIGLMILLLAQVISAFMGDYAQDTYTKYHADWKENLFYTHFLSLPLFLPLSNILTRQSLLLAKTPSVSSSTTASLPSLLKPLINMSTGHAYLFLNSLTQLICIIGVNLLSARSSAVTVTIVLNIRKLVSFVISTWLFGHSLSAKMILGTSLVFGSGALYGYETSWRMPRRRARIARAERNEQRDKEIEGSHTRGEESNAVEASGVENDMATRKRK